MCGISGILEHTPSGLLEQLAQFNARLTHRGPDFQDTYLSPQGGFGMGHCRLSIVDLHTHANQPMSKFAGRYWLSFNGEIYNYIEVRQELLSLGHDFETDSDSEVILAAYAQWGEACLSRFNGMWAFAIWDELEKTLFLARDRFGVKPLYYVAHPDFFCFASEQKAFWQFLTRFNLGHLDAEMASVALHNPPAIEAHRETIYTGINKVLPGECVRLTFHQRPDIRRWWNTYEELHKESGQMTPEGLREQFEQACELRARCDVDLSVALSGGLDSSCVTATLAAQPDARAKNLTAFIGSFTDQSKDEFPFAKLVVEDAALPFERVCVSDLDAAQLLEQSSLSVEEISFLPAIGQMRVYQTMRDKGFKVSIEGHAGDELFGGYPSHLKSHIGDVIDNKGDTLELAASIASLGQLMAGYANPQRDLQGAILSSTSSLGGIPHRTHALGQYLTHSSKLKEMEQSIRLPDGFSKHSRLFQKLYLDFHYLTLPNILRNYDRLSMANSVEIRSPFLDYRVVLAAMALPSEYKLHRGQTKVFLREHIRHLTTTIAQRRDKLGFSPPMQSWLSAGLKSWVEEQLCDRAFLESNVFDGRAVASLLNAKIRRGKMQDVVRFWPLFSLHMLSKASS